MDLPRGASSGGHDRVRGRRPRGDGLRRRRGGGAPRRRVHAVRGRRRRRASTCSRSRARGAGERAAGRAHEPRARAQEPHGLRLGLLPAARPPGHLAAGRRSTRRRERVPARDARATASARVEVDGETRAARSSRPELWWPNGMGEQRLYTSRGDVGSTVGFRDDRAATSYRASSSTACRCRSAAGTGCRSTRSTACRGRRSSRTCSGSRARANVNLLRVWGGGLIETPRVLRALRPARAPRLAGVRPVELRHRERAVGRPGVRRDDGRRRARDRAAPARGIRRSRSGAAATSSTATTRRRCSRALRDVVRELDPERAWLPTSPLGDQRRARAVGAPGPARALRALRHAHVAAAQRVRRRGDDEPRARSRR